MTIIDRIIILLKKQNITQTQFAKDFEHLGVKQQTITDWKSGKSNSYYQIIAEIANYFKVSTDYILGLTDDPTPSKKTLTLDEQVAAEYYKMSPDEREQLNEYMQFLKIKKTLKGDVINGSTNIESEFQPE